MHKNSTLLLYMYFGLLTCFCTACGTEEDPTDFFQHDQFNGNFFTTFDLLNPDTVVANIKEKVPTKWQTLACEGAYYWMSNIHGTVPDSLKFQLLTVIDRSFKDEETQVLTDMFRGKLYTDQRLFDSAIFYLQKSYDLSIRQGMPIRDADIQVKLDKLRQRQNDYPNAINHLLKAHQQYQVLLDTTNDHGRTIGLLPNIASCYHYNKDYEAAKEWCQKYWTLTCSHPGFIAKRTYAAAKLAESYLALNQIDSALIMMDSATTYQAHCSTTYERAYQIYIKGNIEMSQGNCKEALELISQANNLFDLCYYYEKKFQYYHKTGASYRCLGQVDSALFYFNQALNSPDSVLVMDVHQSLADLFTAENQLQKALVHTQKANALEEQLFQSNKIKEVGYLTASFEADQKINQIQYKNRIKKYRFILSLLVLSLLLALTFFLLFSQNKKNKLLEYQKTQMRNLAKIKALELQSMQQELQSTHLKLQDTSEQLQLKQTILDRLQERIDAQELKRQEFKAKDINILTTQDWDQFQESFEREYPHFLLKLQEQYTKLSAAETRLAILLKIGFNSTELAKVLNISAASIYKSRYRLRKKFQLSKEVDLQGWIQKI